MIFFRRGPGVLLFFFFFFFFFVLCFSFPWNLEFPFFPAAFLFLGRKHFWAIFRISAGAPVFFGARVHETVALAFHWAAGFNRRAFIFRELNFSWHFPAFFAGCRFGRS